MSSRSTSRRQVKFYLSEEEYNTLRKRAEELGITVPALVKDVVLESIGKTSYRSIISRIDDLEKKYNQLAEEVGRIEQKLAVLKKRLKEGSAYERI